jgi:uncharacterized phage protein (TIGR02216 family)
MGFGFGVLRLAPAQFWALTPRELAAAYRALVGERRVAPGRPELEQMMERYPDGR